MSLILKALQQIENKASAPPDDIFSYSVEPLDASVETEDSPSIESDDESDDEPVEEFNADTVAETLSRAEEAIESFDAPEVEIEETFKEEVSEAQETAEQPTEQRAEEPAEQLAEQSAEEPAEEPPEELAEEPAEEVSCEAEDELGFWGDMEAESRLAYGALAEEILTQFPSRRPTVLMFTSPTDDEGTTEMLASLAVALVDRVDGEVLLVDADLHNPQLAACVGVEAERGMADVVSGVADWREVVCKTGLPGLSVLPGVKFTRGQGGQLTRLNLGSLFDELTARYRLVLVDAASLSHAEIAPIARWCNGTYLTIKLGRTGSGAAQDAIREIVSHGGHVSGCVAVA